MKKVIILADKHLDATLGIHPIYALVKRFAKDWKPDMVVDVGDTLDLEYFSHFDQDNVMVQSGHCWEDDVDMCNDDLDFWQSLVGKSYYWIEGNHDHRAAKVAEKQPTMSASLSYPRRFNVSKRGIKWYDVEANPCKIGKCTFIHGWWYNKYHARKHLDEYSGNIVYGHVHKNQSHCKTLAADKKEIQAWSIGCLCTKSPAYAKGRPLHWQNGFGIMYLGDKGDFWFYPITIVNNRFIVEGVEYSIGG